MMVKVRVKGKGLHYINEFPQRKKNERKAERETRDAYE